VAVVHGYAEHGGRYARAAEAWTAAGYDVHALDLPGHGRSPGPRADFAGVDSVADTVRSFAESLAAPRFLFGHSAGGAAAVVAAADATDLAGLMLSAPFLMDADPAPTPVVRIGKWLARVAPRLPVRSLDASAVSRDPAEVRAYREDPDVYTGPVRARAGTTMLAMGKRALEHAGRIRTPTLIVHGGADRIADPDGSRRLVERLGSADVRLEIYDGGFHELLNDLERERVTREILAWLESRS
jgi:alpha-beta hydrolase superfamily lysophospholipase